MMRRSFLNFSSHKAVFEVCVMQPSARCDVEETLGLIPRSLFFLFPILKFSVLCNTFHLVMRTSFLNFQKL